MLLIIWHWVRAVQSSTQLWKDCGCGHWFVSKGLLSRIKPNVGLRCLGWLDFDQLVPRQIRIWGSPLCPSCRAAEVSPCQVEPLLGLQHPSQLCGSPAQPMVCVPNWQLSKLFSLGMNQTRQLMTQTEKQGKKHKSFSVIGDEDQLPPCCRWRLG